MCVCVCFYVYVCVCARQKSLTPTESGSTYQGLNRGVLRGREGRGVWVSCPIKSTFNSHYCLSPLLYKTYTQRNLETECLSGQRNYGKAKQSNHKKSKKTARVTDNYSILTCKRILCLSTSLSPMLSHTLINQTLKLLSVIKHHLLSLKKSPVHSEFR